MGVKPFVSDSSGPQRHCDKSNSSCVIYAGGDCHDPSCIPDGWDYDATIIFVGANTGEGSDRGGIGFDSNTEDMCHHFASSNTAKGRKTIVVNSSPGGSAANWVHDVDANIFNFMAGEQMSQAVFNLIEGIVVPSGKLPITLANVDNEVDMTRD